MKPMPQLSSCKPASFWHTLCTLSATAFLAFRTSPLADPSCWNKSSSVGSKTLRPTHLVPHGRPSYDRYFSLSTRCISLCLQRSQVHVTCDSCFRNRVMAMLSFCSGRLEQLLHDGKRQDSHRYTCRSCKDFGATEECGCFFSL